MLQLREAAEVCQCDFVACCAVAQPTVSHHLRVLRRLEARGEIRGGRFVASVSGEQFALPEAVKMLRDTRRAPANGEFVAVSGADPLNLVGTLLPGTKVPALTGNRVLYRDGEPVGALVAGELRWFATLDTATLRKAEEQLVTGRAPLLVAS